MNLMDIMKEKDDKSKEFYFKTTVQGYIDGYSTQEIEEQTNVIKKAIEKIKKLKSEGKSIEEVEDEFDSDLVAFFQKTAYPTIVDFYREETYIYICAHKDELKNSIEEYFFNNFKFNFSNASYTGDMKLNVRKMLNVYIQIILEKDYSQNTRFVEFLNRLKTGTLVESDKELLYEYVLKAIMEEYKYKIEWSKYVRQNPDKIFSYFIRNIEKIFLKDANGNVIGIAPIEREPFYTESAENNLEVYINEIFTDPPVPYSEIYENYREGIEIGDKEGVERALTAPVKNVTRERKYPIKFQLLEIIRFYNENLDLERFNDENNRRLKILNLEDLTVTSQDIIQFLENYDVSQGTSKECIMGMIAFYANRMTKIINKRMRVPFLLRKMNIIRKIYEDDDFNLDELKDELIFNMALFDTLARIFHEDVFSHISNSDLENSNVDENTNKLMQLCEKSVSSYIEVYKKLYESENAEEDFETVMMNNSMFVKGFYAIKDYSLQALLYLALTNQNKAILNWGYVEESFQTGNKVLVAFDIKTLNMPLFLHINKSFLQKVVFMITGQYEIPVYLGENDVIIKRIRESKPKRMTTQILYPLGKKQKKILEKMLANNEFTNLYEKMFIEHLHWIQGGKKMPQRFIDKPRKSYNTKTGAVRIIRNNGENNSGEAPQI